MPEPSLAGLRTILPAVAIALLVCAAPTVAQAPSAPPAAAPQASPIPATVATVTRSGHQLIVSCNQAKDYNCNIVGSTADDVQRALAAPDGGAIDTIVIQETGGDGDPIIALGRLIRAHKLTLEVQRLCAGPCVAFLAPAAARFVVPNGALVVSLPIHSIMRKIATDLGPQGAEVLKNMERQNDAYFAELNVDPQMAYGIGETAFVVKTALAAKGDMREPVVVPDAAFLHNCLRIPAVDMQDYTMAQMKEHVGQDGKAPLAYLIKGKIYFEGNAVADYDPPCGR